MITFSKTKYLSELLTLLASLLWGSSFVAIKIGFEQLDPLWFVQLRMFGAFLFLWLLFRNLPLKNYLANKQIWLMGACHATAYALQFIGMTYISASAAAIYVNLAVVFTALFSYLFLKEYFGAAKIAGLIISVIGIFLLATNGDLSVLKQQSILMGFLVIASSMFWSLYAVFNKQLLMDKTIQVVPFTAAVLLISSSLLLIPALLTGHWPGQLTLVSAGVLIYTTLFCTVATFLLFAKGLRGISATVSATILLTEPLFAVVLAYPILGELFKPFEAVGAALILLALVLILLSNSRA